MFIVKEIYLWNLTTQSIQESGLQGLTGDVVELCPTYEPESPEDKSKHLRPKISDFPIKMEDPAIIGVKQVNIKANSVSLIFKDIGSTRLSIDNKYYKVPEFDVLCFDPSSSEPSEQLNELKKKQSSEMEALQNDKKRRDNFKISTGFSFVNHKIEDELGIVTAECVFGMNIFRDLFSGVRDIVGGRSKASQKVLRDARNTCLEELKNEALELGADGVMGVDLDYSEISGAGKSMLFLVASGTAVKFKK